MSAAPYFDFAATTRVDERVANVVVHHMCEEFGNSGSRTHLWGARAAAAVESARAHVANVINATPDEVVFTSGATESNNLAILGLREHAESTKRRHIVSTSIEHKAVIEPIEHLQSMGFDVTFVQPSADGTVEADQIAAAVRDDTVLVSVMHVNNETGMIQPLDRIATELEGHSAYFHVDAAQGFGKELTLLRNSRIDFVSISGHKIYAPKGIGALVARKRNGHERPPLQPLMRGGGQERGLRPGTVPVALVAGLGEAARLALAEYAERTAAARAIEKRVLEFVERAGGAVNGDRSRAIPQIVNAGFRGLDSEAFIVATKEQIAVSNGAACSSHAYERSHVLEAMNLEPWRVSGAIRLSFSHQSEFPDLDELIRVVESVRF